MLSRPPQRLIPPVGGVLGSDDPLQRHMRVLRAGRLLDPAPQPTRADRLGLARVTDQDQPRTALLGGAEKPVLSRVDANAASS